MHLRNTCQRRGLPSQRKRVYEEEGWNPHVGHVIRDILHG